MVFLMKNLDEILKDFNVKEKDQSRHVPNIIDYVSNGELS